MSLKGGYQQIQVFSGRNRLLIQVKDYTEMENCYQKSRENHQQIMGSYSHTEELKIDSGTSSWSVR